MEPYPRDPTSTARHVRVLLGSLQVVLIRYRIGRWAVAVAAAAIAAVSVSVVLADARDARSSWGDGVEVVRARSAMEPGAIVTSANVEIVSMPAGLVPVGAITEPPVGRRVTAPVEIGEILVERRLTSRRGSAAAIALPAGARGVMLDRGQVFGEVGDNVELYALVSGAGLAEAVIVHSDESSVTVAVPAADVASVVDAISQGGVVSVLVP